MWTLTPWPGIELVSPALEAENINHPTIINDQTDRKTPPLLHLTFSTKIGTGWEFLFHQNRNFGPVFYCSQGAVCFSKQAEEEWTSFSPEILFTRNCQCGGSPISRPSPRMPLNSRKQKEQTPTQNMWKKKAMRSFKCLPPKFTKSQNQVISCSQDTPLLALTSSSNQISLEALLNLVLLQSSSKFRKELLENFASVSFLRASQVALVLKKKKKTMQETWEVVGSIPGSRRSPGEGNGNPLQYSCLENPMDRGAWRSMVHRVAKSRAALKRLSTAQHSADLWCTPESR